MSHNNTRPNFIGYETLMRQVLGEHVLKEAGDCFPYISTSFNINKHSVSIIDTTHDDMMLEPIGLSGVDIKYGTNIIRGYQSPTFPIGRRNLIGSK